MSGPSTYTRIAAPIASSESRETARAQSNSDLPSPAQSSSIIRELAIVSLIVAPLAFLPFLPLRRRLRTISDHLLEIKCQQAEALRLSTLARTRQDRLAETTRTELLKHKEDTGARIGALTREVQLLQRGLLDVQARADKEANENKEATRRDYMSMRGDVKALAHRVQVVADKEPTVRYVLCLGVMLRSWGSGNVMIDRRFVSV